MGSLIKTITVRVDGEATATDTVEATTTEAVDTEVADTEVEDTKAADTEATDTENTETMDTEAVDTEVTVTETVDMVMEAADTVEDMDTEEDTEDINYLPYSTYL